MRFYFVIEVTSVITRGGAKSLFCRSQVSLESLHSSPESSPSQVASPRV